MLRFQCFSFNKNIPMDKKVCYIQFLKNKNIIATIPIRRNNYFVYLTEHNLGMGGGGKGFSFLLDEDLSQGSSCRCVFVDIV